MSTPIALIPGGTTIGTLHLTQILVPCEDAVRLHRIRDTYDWHQHVWRDFAGIIPHRPDKGRVAKGTRPEKQERTPPDFLCRIDEVENSYRLLILSTTPPMKPDWCHTHYFGTKVIPDEYFTHARYRFSFLVAKACTDVGLKDAADIALFGRMVANDPSIAVEGAAMFSHALSTHKAHNDLDFYTGGDDRQKEDPTVSEEDRTGSCPSRRPAIAPWFGWRCFSVPATPARKPSSTSTISSRSPPAKLAQT